MTGGYFHFSPTSYIFIFIRYAIIPTLCPLKPSLSTGLVRVMECVDKDKPVSGVLIPLVSSSGLVSLLCKYMMAF